MGLQKNPDGCGQLTLGHGVVAARPHPDRSGTELTLLPSPRLAGTRPATYTKGDVPASVVNPLLTHPATISDLLKHLDYR